MSSKSGPRCCLSLAAVLCLLSVTGVATGAAEQVEGEQQVLLLTDPATGQPAGVPLAPGVLHVVYFATWCPECVAELPALTDLEDRWAERDYRLVLVAVSTRQTAARLAKFIESSHPPGRLLFDADGRAERGMRVEQLPTHVLLGSNGAEFARGAGVDEIRAPLEARLRSQRPGKP